MHISSRGCHTCNIYTLAGRRNFLRLDVFWYLRQCQRYIVLPSRLKGPKLGRYQSFFALYLD